MFHNSLSRYGKNVVVLEQLGTKSIRHAPVLSLFQACQNMIDTLAQSVQDYMKRPLDNQNAQELMYGVRMFAALQRSIRSCLHPLQYPTSEELPTFSADRRTQLRRLTQLQLWNRIAQHRCRCEECMHLVEIGSDHMATLPLWLCECYAMDDFDEIDKMLPPKMRAKRNELQTVFAQVPVTEGSRDHQPDTSLFNGCDLVSVYRAPLFCFWVSCQGYEIKRIGLTFDTKSTHYEQLKDLLESDLVKDKNKAKQLFNHIKNRIARENNFFKYQFIVAIEIPKARVAQLRAVVTVMQLKDGMLEVSRDLKWLHPTGPPKLLTQVASFVEAALTLGRGVQDVYHCAFLRGDRELFEKGIGDQQENGHLVPEITRKLRMAIKDSSEFKLNEYKQLEWKNVFDSQQHQYSETKLQLAYQTRILMQCASVGDDTVVGIPFGHVPVEQQAHFTLYNDNASNDPSLVPDGIELVLSKQFPTEGMRWAIAFTPSQKEWELSKFEHLLDHDDVIVKDNVRDIMQCLRTSWTAVAEDRSMTRSIPSFNLSELQFDCVRCLREQSLMFVSDLTEALACEVNDDQLHQYSAFQDTIGQFASKIKVITEAHHEQQSSPDSPASHAQQMPSVSDLPAQAKKPVREIELAILQR
jgi:hypothetical protein